jgi:phenylacetate-CoA ligase
VTYAAFVRNALFPAVQTFLGGGTLNYIKEWERTQWLSAGELRSMQLAKLQKMLAHAAAAVPYYRNSFRAAGFEPGDLKSIDDLARLPVLDKGILREHASEFVAEGVTEKMFTAKTGGSTGEPLSFPIGISLRAASMANMVRCRRWWGIDIGDGSANFWGHSRYVRGRRLDEVKRFFSTVKGRALNRIVCSAYDLSDEAMEEYWRRIERFRPAFFIGYATSLYVFADFVMRRGYKGDTLGLKAVISTAEVLYDWQETAVRRAFGSPVVNEYGMCEAGIVAYQCPSGSMHVMDESLIVEILPVEGSASGDIVITELENYAAPLVRYNTKDMASLVRGPCECKRGLSRISKVEGRAYDIIYAADGKVVAGALLTHVMKSTPGIAKYQILQKGLRELEITYTETRPLSEPDKRAIAATLRRHLGESVDVKLTLVDELTK